MLMQHGHHSRAHGDGAGSRSAPSPHQSVSSREDIYDAQKRESDEEDYEDEEEDDDAPTPVNEGMAANSDFQWLHRPVDEETPPMRHPDSSATLVRPKHHHHRVASPPAHSMVPWPYNPYPYGYHPHMHHMPPPPPVCCCAYEEYNPYQCVNYEAQGERPRRHSHHEGHGSQPYYPSTSYGTFPCQQRKGGCAGATPRPPLYGRPPTHGTQYYDHALVLPNVLDSRKQSNVMGGEMDDWQEKVHQLQVEKENLQLQVSVLSEQVEAQGEKIRELETALDDRKEQLDGTEEILQQEMVSRSHLENSKLDLLGQVTELKRKVAILDQERMEQAERNKRLEEEIILTKSRLVERDAELTTLRARLARNGTITPTIVDQYSEIDKLRQALDSVIATKEEREKKIEELTLQVSRQKRVQDWLPHERRASDLLSPDITQNSLYSPSGDSNRSEWRLLDKPPPGPRLVSTPVSSPVSPSGGNDPRYSPSPSQSSLRSAHKASSTENVTPTGTRTPPAKRHYSTIPRQHGLQVLQQIQQQLQQHKMESGGQSPSNTNGSLPTSPSVVAPPPPSQSQSQHNLSHPSLEVFRSPSVSANGGSSRKASAPGVSFGKVFFRLRNGKRSCSAPELAEPEIVPAPLEGDSMTLPRDSQQPLRLETKEKSKGLKKIFGKLRRSGSHSMELKESEFRRGGVRSSAGPRLGWDNHRASPQPQKSVRPFKEWGQEETCNWLEALGLGAYLPEGGRWLKGGEQLLKSTSQEQEKELGIKNPLHRKKLQLALKAVQQEGDNVDPVLVGAGQLDHHWVVRWLDDVGLPQYKDSFVDARVDGRVLHFLTVEDLLSLKVSNCLHHVSIKRGIQVLRQRSFDPHCLKRRSLPDESKEYRPEDVVLWSNHRVMEWLKTVDLSEYAPNLRGSGVHGALIVYEARFNADLLAALLNIPSSKSLLRRHLGSQFKSLVGPTLVQDKRDAELSPSAPPLTPNTKVKSAHKAQFPLLRSRKGKGDVVDYACPLTLSSEQSVFRDLAIPESNSTPSEKTEEEIGAVSKDISTLTNQLQDEQLLASMAATNV